MGIIGLLLFILTGQGRQEISALGTLKLEGDKKAVALAGLVVSWTLVPVQQRVPDGRRASSLWLQFILRIVIRTVVVIDPGRVEVFCPTERSVAQRILGYSPLDSSRQTRH